MIAHKLEKEITLYKNQFERFNLQLFGSHKLDRVSIDLDGMLFRIKYMVKHKKDLDRLPELRRQFTETALELRNIFGEFMYNLLTQIVTIPEEFHLEDIEDVLAQDVKIDTTFVKFKMILVSKNKKYLEYVDDTIPDGKTYNMFPNEFFRYYTDSYNDGISKAFPELFENRQQDKVGVGADADVFVHNFTFQTSERCSLNCTYCYQMNKTGMRMDFNVAKKFIDELLTNQYGYINQYNSPAIIIEFIGGEPLLEIKLTRKIYEYFLDRCYELNHPWFTLHRLSICSNGLQYFDEAVQSFFKDYAQNVSFNISIDGNKELHDSCRIQPNGEGSYDMDMMALNHFNRNYTPERNSKMTLAPQNMKYLFDSVVNFINNGMTCINLNCIFEEGWDQNTAKLEYDQLKKLADYLLDNDLEHLYIAIFNERQEDMQSKYSDGNFCFKTGTPLATPNGNISIENIQTGELVYTASGSIHQVSKMSKHRSIDNKILNVTGAFPTHCTSNHKFFAKKFLYIGWKGMLHYSEPGFYPLFELKKGDRIALPVLDFSNNKSNWIDNNTAYAIGVYLADGYINGNTVTITPGYDEDGFYKDVLKNAGLTFNERSMRTSARYEILRSRSDINERFFKVCQSCGRGAHNKHFPSIAFSSHESIIREIMRGYEEADGCSTNNGKVKVNTVSHALANDYMLLLRSMGEYPTCYLNKRDGTTMVIEGRTVNVRDRYEIYYNPTDRNAHFMFKLDMEYPIMWTRIRSIEKDPEEYEVYCPTVMPIHKGDSEEHTIIANGLASLNCGGLGSMLSLRPNGQFYPCIRYMPTSVGDDVPDLCIGHVDSGIVGREEESEVLGMMDRITRRSQSNDICYECPLSNDCAWCFRAGTLIQTINGPVRIENIHVGDEVLSQDGKYHKVYQNLFRSASTKETMVIKGVGTPSIYTTEDHPFWAKKRLARYNGSNRDIMYADPQWIKAKDLSPNDRIIMYTPDFGDIEVNYYLAYLVGRWLGDGWRSDRSSHNRKVYPQFHLCCAYDEIEEVESLLSYANIEYTKDNTKRTAQEYLIKSNTKNENNRKLISILKQCGKYSHGKRIPEEIFKWNKESLAALFEGYLSADGSKEKRPYLTRFCTVSKELAYGLSTICRMFGKNPSWTEGFSNTNVIEGRIISPRMFYDIRMYTSDNKQYKTDVDFDNDEMWVAVRSAKHIGAKYNVYNIGVEDDPSFYADGVLVHNCSALSHTVYGTPGKRPMFICIQMIAEALANVYYWNLLNIKHPEYELGVRENVVPDKWALLVIDEEELDFIKKIESYSMIITMQNSK